MKIFMKNMQMRIIQIRLRGLRVIKHHLLKFERIVHLHNFNVGA